MPTVQFTRHLQRFFDSLETVEVAGETVAEVLDALDERFPGILDYVVDEQGRLRTHVNVFIGNDMIEDRQALSDSVEDDDEIYVMQALSGG